MNLGLTIFIVVSAWMNAVDAYYPSFGEDEYTYVRTSLGDAIDKATLKVLKEAYDSGDDKNVITSPLGVMLLLSLYSGGAGNGSRQEITSLLGGGDYKQLTESYSGLSNMLAATDPSYLTIANKIYVSDRYQLKESFANTAKSYSSEVESIDFLDAENAAKIINKWSDEKTKGHIKSPVTKDILTPDTVAGLFNVIFFKGHWHVPFDAKDTENKDFHVDKETTVKKPTMKLSQTFFYAESEDLGAKLIELPYKETGFRMVVVLPNEVDGLPAILEKASQKGLLEDVFKLSPSDRVVELEIPKFDVKSKLDLNEILPKVGITRIFQEPAAGIVKDDKVIITKGLQEAFVKVDEEGATAGAFTGFIADAVIESVGAPPPPPLQFKADHPFMFLILHEDKALFAGTYTH